MGVNSDSILGRADKSREVYSVVSMFVRFRKCELRKGGNTLIAELVESYRDERKGGNPRNRYIAYLGSIREEDCSDIVRQAKFWRGVEARLARLRLSTDDEKRVREKIQARVPKKSWSDIVSYLSKFSRRKTGLNL